MNAITGFKNISKSSKPVYTSIHKFLDGIYEGKWQDQILELRNNLERKAEIKKNLPFFCISGKFEKRSITGLSQHSNLICIDVDKIDVDSVKEVIKNDPYTMSVFTSCSGSGVAIIVKIEGDKHQLAFESIADYYFKQFGLHIDQACKDVSRARFVSFDPDIYVNDDSQVFKQYIKPRPKKKIKTFVFSNTDIDFVLGQITKNNIDITGDYRQWIDICFSLQSSFGEGARDYFHIVSQNSSSYDQKKCDKQFDNCLKAGRSGVNIATFFHYCKEANINIISSQTKSIVTAAKQGKKGHIEKDSVIDGLKQLNGIDKEESQPIIDQIYESNIPLTDENELPLIEQVETYLKTFDVKRNIVSRKMELKGEEMTDMDFKEIWRKAVHTVNEKVRRSFIEDIITSRFYKEFNPIKDFFEENSHRKPKGLIKKLADSITSDTGLDHGNFFGDYKEYFIKKWLVGLVSAVFDEYSPLVLVLTGIKQGTGKTHFFRHLLPKVLQKYYGESKLDRGKDDEILMCQKLLIIDDEFGGKSKADEKKLKDLTSKQYFTLREPYGRSNVDLRRLATLGGTSNDDQLLNDPSGNRRIIPINVTDRMNFDLYNSIDKTDLLIEAYNLFKEGYEWRLLNKDIDLLNGHTEAFKGASIEGELIHKYYSTPEDSPGQLPINLTTTDIKVFLEKESQQKMSIKKLGMELKSLGFVQKMVKSNGKVNRYYSICIKNE